jgi:hypothetical protein
MTNKAKKTLKDPGVGLPAGAYCGSEGRARQSEHTTNTTEKTATGGSPVPRFDLEKLHIQFCPAAQAELNAKEAVLADLRRRAKSAGKHIRGGTESIVGPQRCDARWLWPTLEQMSRDRR